MSNRLSFASKTGRTVSATSLMSAIPAVVAYNYFNRRIKVLSAEMTTFGSDYTNIVKRHFF